MSRQSVQHSDIDISLATETLESHYRAILEDIGEDPSRAGILDTPRRAAKAFKFCTSGYTLDAIEVAKNALFESDNDEMVIVKNIEFYSYCEHHLVPFFGKCHVGYLPNGKILGLSKIARIVDVFARRLQVQENLTQQIAKAMEAVTEAKGVGVVMEAQHLCMMMRGVQKQNSLTTTSCNLKLFRSDARTRSEFLSLIPRPS